MPRGKWIALLLIVAIGAAGLILYRDYGISSDEEAEVQMVLWNLHAIGSGHNWNEIPEDLEYYGFYFNLLGVLPYLGRSWALEPGGIAISERILRGLTSGAIYPSKHLFTFASSLLAYLGVLLSTKEFVGWKYASLGGVALLLTPRFWGHSFFNPKDIPFAALFILVSWAGARFTCSLADADSLRPALLFGALAAALTGIRVGGLVVLCFVPTVLAATYVWNRRPPAATWRSRLLACAVAFATWAGLSILLYPASWSSPVRWLEEAVAFHAHHNWQGVTLTFGKYLDGHNLPWYYVPAWLGVTTPLLVMLLAAIGWSGCLLRFRSLSRLQQNLFLWCTLQALALPVAATIGHSTLYNAERQFLFVLPAATVFAGVGAASLLSGARSATVRVGLIAVMSCGAALVLRDMVALHPYEYIYFNETVRTPDLDRRFETDYWILSGREAMEWINDQASEKKLVYFQGPRSRLQPFAGANVELVEISGAPIFENLRKPSYYLAYSRNKFGTRPGPQELLPECKEVYRVQKTLENAVIPLTIVRRCG